MTQNMQPLIDYLKAEMAAREWNIMDVARRCDLAHPLVSRWLAGANVPSIRSCQAIARAFGITEDEVIRMAGYLSPSLPLTDDADRAAQRFGAAIRQLPAKERQDVVDIALDIVRGRQRRLDSEGLGQ